MSPSKKLINFTTFTFEEKEKLLKGLLGAPTAHQASLSITFLLEHKSSKLIKLIKLLNQHETLS